MVSKPSDAGARSFVLLAPSERAVPRRFESVDCDPGRYYDLLAQVQTLRGRIYLEDGAIVDPLVTSSTSTKAVGTSCSWTATIASADVRAIGSTRTRSDSRI